MTIVVVLVWAELWLLLRARSGGWREAGLAATVIWSLLLLALSEGLSLVDAFARVPVFCAWLALLLALAWPLRHTWMEVRRRLARQGPRTWRVDVGALCLVVPPCLTLIVALVAPPNTVDSLTYHLGRVAEWLDRSSIAHFATHVERQAALNPFAEIVIANLYALSGGDRFANLVQWFAFGLNAMGASLLARELGGDARTQMLAALLVLTTPMAVLQASSTQNDLVCSFFVVTTVLHCLSFKADFPCALVLGMSAGLAILTKGTALVFIAPFVLWALRRAFALCKPRRGLVVLGLAGVLVLAINTPHGVRNQRVFGTPLGTQWLATRVGNQVRGLRTVYSNLVRNVASHVALPSARWPRVMRAAVVGLHSVAGVDANDPRTTLDGPYQAAGFSTHEDAAPNPVQMLLFIVAAVLLARCGTRSQRWFWLMVLLGFVLYAAVFKWQPWGSRLHTPFFILGAAPVAIAVHTTVSRSRRLSGAATVALLVLAAPWLLVNATRAIVPGKLFTERFHITDIWSKTRTELYFANRPADYLSFVTLREGLRADACADVGVLGSEDSWTYALFVMLRKPDFDVRLRPVLVQNPTAALSRAASDPCALVSLAYGRRPGPESTSLVRFRLAWHEGSFALYLPSPAALP